MSSTVLRVEPHREGGQRGIPRPIDIPMSSVLGAIVDPSVMRQPRGIPLRGLSFFGRLSGLYTRAGERSWWHVTPGSVDRVVVIQCADHHISRLVVSVDDPEQVVRSINRVLVA